MALRDPSAELAILKGTPEQQVERLALLHRVGLSLSTERDRDRLVEMILLEAKRLCRADGGTLYLRTDDDQLEFSLVHNDSLGLAQGGTSGVPVSLPPLHLYDDAGQPNSSHVAAYAVHRRQSVRIGDAYSATEFDFSGTRAFDRQCGYRSKSLLTIPLIGNEDRVIAVLQLVNARHRRTAEVICFDHHQQVMVEALASQAAIALDNKLLLDAQDALIDAIIKLIANAVDAKSPHTGGHCSRVPVLTQMLAEAACAAEAGPFADFNLDAVQFRELQAAAWLHDCGKIVTPVHVMDKATKLQTIVDRIDLVRTRYELVKRDRHIAWLEQLLRERTGAPAPPMPTALVQQLDDEFEFLARTNCGAESLSAEDEARIRDIGQRERVRIGQTQRPLLDADELENLTISRGTLTEAERRVINDHVVQTINMLEALPLPRHLRRVPEYAAGHHERMDGRGYPRGIYAGDMSIPARMMVIADVFEALTAGDRPYRAGKPLSQAMEIMGSMKRDNHIDPDLFDLFVRSKTYLRYATQYLPPEAVDAVDEAPLLGIQPEPLDLPGVQERQQRWSDFLPGYRQRRR